MKPPLGITIFCALYQVEALCLPMIVPLGIMAPNTFSSMYHTQYTLLLDLPIVVPLGVKVAEYNAPPDIIHNKLLGRFDKCATPV